MEQTPCYNRQEKSQIQRTLKQSRFYSFREDKERRMSKEVKLLGIWGSPFSRRVEMALQLKGIPYEYLEEDVLTHKSELLLKYNPVTKKVPVLVHNGKPMAESLVILEYIDETWKDGYSLFPQDLYLRANARFWTRYIDEKVIVDAWKACWAKESEREKAVEEASESMRNLENELADKRFFGGDEIGAVDLAACFFAFWLQIIQEVTGVEILTAEKFPKLFKWTEEFAGHGAVKENLPPRDRLMAHFQAMLPK